MVAGLVSSNAQVYSANVVGYANVVIAGAAGQTLVANPFDDGNGNQLTNLLAGLPNKSQVLTWGGVGYNSVVTKTNGVWNGNVSLPPGAGFFVKNGIASSPVLTNTFVGSVVVNISASTTNPVAAGFTLAAAPFLTLRMQLSTRISIWAQLTEQKPVDYVESDRPELLRGSYKD